MRLGPAVSVLALLAGAWAAVPQVAAEGVAGVPAEARAAESSATVVRVFEIRYRDVGEVSMLIQPALAPAVLTVNRATRTVTVVDRPEVVRKVEEFIRQFDVPPHVVVVRIVLEKAQLRPLPAGGGADGAAGGRLMDASAWEYVPLAETTFEVLERAHARHSFGDDGAFEIHVHLDSVDVERTLIRFDEVTLARLDEAAGDPAGPRERRELFRTALDLQDRVGKVVMAAQEPTAREALVLRVVGLVRDRTAGGQ